MGTISDQKLLEVLPDFDELGGANLELVAWELCVSDRQAVVAWEYAVNVGWLKPAGHDTGTGEQLWRLSASGWATARRQVTELGNNVDPPKSAA